MTNQKRTENPRRFVFGNERFGGSFSPGEFEFNYPDDMSAEEFERIFTRKLNSFYRRGRDLHDKYDHKSRKENLKPLSIRVKPHTKDFFKNHSILSPRDVLEMYENFNNGSEAFINSLLEEEKSLERELEEVQEKLHNAKLFKEKLSEIDPDNDILTDEGKLAKLEDRYPRTEIKTVGIESPLGKVESDIIRDIQIYNTLDVSIHGEDYLILTVYTNAQPVLYYFKNEYPKEDISELASHIEEFCSENKIGFRKFDE